MSLTELLSIATLAMDIRSKIIDYLLVSLRTNELRNACYLCEDLCNIFQEEFWGKCNLIYTESFIECMLNHSDIDMMHVCDDFPVLRT